MKIAWHNFDRERSEDWNSYRRTDIFMRYGNWKIWFYFDTKTHVFSTLNLLSFIPGLFSAFHQLYTVPNIPTFKNKTLKIISEKKLFPDSVLIMLMML